MRPLRAFPVRAAAALGQRLAGLAGMALCLGAAPVTAEPLPAPTVSERIADYEIGVICAVPPDRIDPAPNTVSGTKYVVEETPEFVARTRTVPAVRGVGFGVVARAAAVDGIDGIMVVNHPPFPGTGTTVQSFPTRVPGAEEGITFYQFDHGYELAVGRWRLTFVGLDGEPVYSVAFDVVPPESLPSLAKACGYAELLS